LSEAGARSICICVAEMMGYLRPSNVERGCDLIERLWPEHPAFQLTITHGNLPDGK
jgi:hypothetical protein